MEYTEIEVAKKVVELADAKPDFVYKAPKIEADNEYVFAREDGALVDEDGYEVNPEAGDCKYVHTDGDLPVAGCLYGQALHALGMPLSELLGHENESVAGLFGQLTWLDQSPLVRAMNRSQQDQDGGKPWGEAIEPVKAALAEVTA